MSLASARIDDLPGRAHLQEEATQGREHRVERLGDVAKHARLHGRADAQIPLAHRLQHVEKLLQAVLQGLALVLALVQHARVLDGKHRLVGKDLDNLDGLFGGAAPILRRVERENPQHVPIAGTKQRHEERILRVPPIRRARRAWRCLVDNHASALEQMLVLVWDEVRVADAKLRAHRRFEAAELGGGDREAVALLWGEPSGGDDVHGVLLLVDEVERGDGEADGAVDGGDERVVDVVQAHIGAQGRTEAHDLLDLMRPALQLPVRAASR